MARRPGPEGWQHSRSDILKPGKRKQQAANSRQGGIVAGQWYAQALKSHQAHEWPKAETLYGLALKAYPEHVDSLHMLGVLLAQTGRPAEAAEHIASVLQHTPDDIEALANLANTLNLLRRHEEALASLDRLITLDAGNVEAHVSRAESLRGLGRHEASLAAADLALTLAPGHPRACVTRGNALRRLDRFVEALEELNGVLAARPAYPEAENDRGNILFDLRRFDEALDCFDRALGLRPHYTEACFNRANTLRAMQRFEDAVAAYDALIAAGHANAETLNNRGAAFEMLGRYEDARASYQAAQQADPGHVMAHLNEALCAFLQGDFAHGWPLYRWRVHAPEARMSGPVHDSPAWDGQASLAGKRILLRSEQGLGDCIQFCRFAPQLASRGAEVILETWPSLTSLMSRLEGVSRVIPHGEALPPADFHAWLLDLPGLLGVSLDSIPAQASYLQAPPGLAKTFTEYLNETLPTRRLRVGLVWSGLVWQCQAQ
ncbi:MAG: hypothetical protein CGU29_15950 [Candidatus Dactylopiibacterium carminicum]|uniref:Uncharacterized protein n=1 Tax=Candidatus Dactylopiibacterium carminicum TaxID=857335 RepID=A0A272EN24_9RHOO|nr:tetratricopeptide repeat protein [Candidatus Dactylopiibacterium carminicum]KAF7597955.1 hypothetical protein BGI27_15910 [Candidatus Dactylopiibacterium carminicum]PAS91528.1 MAG: hypothetical protein CGU29_15950 [Candidatus Dactylopiibacterium carminicum]PAS96106.1 MAG: hypothetical protein BSR46_15940 [Candidatus Dactylopiibacterium carminicum]